MSTRRVSRRKILQTAGAMAGMSVLVGRTGRASGDLRKEIRVLFVGGDWKSMLPNYHYMKDGKPAVRPLRGFYTVLGVW